MTRNKRLREANVYARQHHVMEAAARSSADSALWIRDDLSDKGYSRVEIDEMLELDIPTITKDWVRESLLELALDHEVVSFGYDARGLLVSIVFVVTLLPLSSGLTASEKRELEAQKAADTRAKPLVRKILSRMTLPFP